MRLADYSDFLRISAIIRSASAKTVRITDSASLNICNAHCKELQQSRTFFCLGLFIAIHGFTFCAYEKRLICDVPK